MIENNKLETGTTQPANSYRTSSAKTKTPRGNNRFLPNKDLSRERTVEPGRNQERTTNKKNIHVTCQTQSKSSKRARNVKLMALILHRNRREGTEKER